MNDVVDIYELGLFIKDIDNLNMDTFDGRLRFQKKVQLLQSFGFDLGYDYNWYLRGPYSPELTKDGFKLKNIINNIPKLVIEFADDNDQHRYNRFKEFLKDKKNDQDKLEIAASITFLHNDEKLSKDSVLRLTEGKREHFTMKECEKIWDQLENCGVVSS